MRTIEQHRQEYQRTVAAIRAILPGWKEMQGTIQRSAEHAAEHRLGQRYRFYTGPAAAAKAKVAGLPYPEESLVRPEDYVAAAHEALVFAQWIVDNGLDQLPDDARF